MIVIAIVIAIVIFIVIVILIVIYDCDCDCDCDCVSYVVSCFDFANWFSFLTRLAQVKLLLWPVFEIYHYLQLS